jgi:hypothetical protein
MQIGTTQKDLYFLVRLLQELHFQAPKQFREQHSVPCVLHALYSGARCRICNSMTNSDPEVKCSRGVENAFF